MYNSVVFSMVTELCNHYYLILEHFHHPQKKSQRLGVTPYYPSLHALATTTQLLPLDLPTCTFHIHGITCTWNFIHMESHTMWLLCRASSLSIMFSRFIHIVACR